MDSPPAIIIDGDTLRIGAERIRLIDIDAPEMASGARRDAERNLAELAKTKLTEIIAGQPLEIDRRGKDRFGRTLAYVRVSGADVGEMLIRARVAVRWEGRRMIDLCNEVNLPLRFPEGVPNIEPADSIRITDRAPILRNGSTGINLEMMRWSWPSPKGAPVFNFRSENRRFDTMQRCLIPAHGFYEFTASKDAKAKRKDKWLFTLKHSDLFAIAGVWRAGAANSHDAWAMLTCPPGPDIAPYHDRQVVVLPPQARGRAK